MNNVMYWLNKHNWHPSVLTLVLGLEIFLFLSHGFPAIGFLFAFKFFQFLFHGAFAAVFCFCMLQTWKILMLKIGD